MPALGVRMKLTGGRKKLKLIASSDTVLIPRLVQNLSFDLNVIRTHAIGLKSGFLQN